MDKDLRYTDEAELNRYLFYSDLNEINVFIEDKNKEYEYETIFERLFEGEYKIASIISANGKKGVKKAFEEFGKKDIRNLHRNNIYIVDGDFDRYIHKNDMIEDNNFIYLKHYNIENYFIDENAVIKFAKGKLCLLDNEVRKAVNYEFWKKTIVEQAKPLFLLHCAVQKSLPDIKNVSRNEYDFIDGMSGFENKTGYKDYYNEIRAIKSDIDVDIDEIRMCYEQINGDDYYSLICGKFLFISLYNYLRGKIKKKFNKEELRWALVTNFDVSSLDFIKIRVDNIIKNTSIK